LLGDCVWLGELDIVREPNSITMGSKPKELIAKTTQNLQKQKQQ